MLRSVMLLLLLYSDTRALRIPSGLIQCGKYVNWGFIQTPVFAVWRNNEDHICKVFLLPCHVAATYWGTGGLSCLLNENDAMIPTKSRSRAVRPASSLDDSGATEWASRSITLFVNKHFFCLLFYGARCVLVHREETLTAYIQCER